MYIYHLQFNFDRIARQIGTMAFARVRPGAADESVTLPRLANSTSMDRKSISKKREYDHA
jgi:hypothetical protein